MPGLFAEQLVPTANTGEGPFYPDRMPLDTDNDLLIINDAITPAVGEISHLTGRVLSITGQPIPQRVRRDLAGRQQGVVHPQWRRKHRWSRRELSGLRPLPDGLERAVLLSNHQADFATLRGQFRAAHIHIAVSKGGKRVFTTQIAVNGHPDNARDFVYTALNRRDLATILTDFKPMPDSKLGELTANFDAVLGPNRGRVRRPHAARSGKGARLMSETQILASYVLDSRLEDIPADVRHEARRALVNYVGCAVGGSLHPAVDLAIRALGPYSGPANCQRARTR